MINFDTISIACALREMETAVVGARVERVSQPSAHATQWSFYGSGEKHTVWIETDAASSRIHVTRRGRQSPPNPPAFCMLLRKLLGGAWLEGIDRPQGMGERIVCLHFVNPAENRRYRLMVELMGRHGNQILIDENNTILGAIKRVTPQMSRFREVRGGISYTTPPRQSGARRNLFAPGAGNDLPQETFAGLAEAERWASATFTGASPLMIREGLARMTHSDQDGGVELNSESVWFGLSNLLNYVRLADYSPVLLTDALGRITGAYPIVLRTLAAAQQPIAVSFSEAVDEASDALEQRSSFEGEKAALVSALVRARRIFTSELLDIEEGLANAERADEYRASGELINIHQGKIRAGSERASLLDYASGEEIEIELDPSLSPHDNAERYFARFHKAKASTERLLERREKVENGARRIEDALPRAEAVGSLDAVQALVDQLEDIQELFNKKPAGGDSGAAGQGGKKQQEAPYAGHKIRTYHSVDGWEILVGETAESNDYLTTKVASPSDIWLHARAQTSAHAVIRSQNKPAAVSAAAIRYAAEQVAKRSTSKHSRLVPVDYTLKKYVRKPRGAKPGSVLYSREKTIDVAPDAVAATRRDAESRL